MIVTKVLTIFINLVVVMLILGCIVVNETTCDTKDSWLENLGRMAVKEIPTHVSQTNLESYELCIR